MRIAQIAQPWLTVPPDGYGGIEAMVALLCVPPLPHILRAYERAGDFDIVHDHTFPLGPSIAASLPRPPVLHTVHGPPDHPTARPIYEALGDRVPLVAISNFQRQAVPGLNYVATVYNGIDVQRHPWRAEKDDYLLFVGRMTADKGVHLAVETARRLGRRLRVVGKMAEPAEISYFESDVEPLLTNDIERLGEVSDADKLELYAGAVCTLMPVLWPEPFGLVMVESMACGTPVVALRNGSVPEVVDHGVTGFIADDLDSFVDAVGQTGDIDPRACRDAVESRFSKEAMVDGYEGVYRSVGN